MKKLFAKIKQSIEINRSLITNEGYVNYLRTKGLTIGEDCQFFARRSLYFDMTRPFLISFGNNVIVTKGVTIMTHGYDWAVLKHLYKKVIGSAKPVKIGNNIFIGVNSVILPGTIINDNVIIGSGSVVSGNILSDSVYAGNPAKKIMSIEEYYLKREKGVLDEVINLVKCYIEKFNRFPPKIIFYEHFDLFTPRDKDKFDIFKQHIFSKTRPYFNEFMSTEPKFKDYDTFVSYIKENLNYHE